jgi:hypothetical protein
MRKFAISLAAIFLGLALALYLWRIGPLLPERGGTTCFAGDYDPPRPIDLSSPRRDKKNTAEVKSMRLRIVSYPDSKPFRDERSGRGYDRIYSLRLDLDLADGRNLSASSSCEWTDNTDRFVPALFCYIDCDGGSVSVFRKIGQNALSAWFEPGERLRTGQTCDGGGGVFIGAEKEWRGLPVRPAKCTE